MMYFFMAVVYYEFGNRFSLINRIISIFCSILDPFEEINSSTSRAFPGTSRSRQCMLAAQSQGNVDLSLETEGHFTHSKSVQDFSERKNFYGFFVDFLKQKDEISGSYSVPK